MHEPLGLILAGGRGVRMGGVAKADLTLAGVRLLDRVADRLEPQVGAVAVNANTAVETAYPVIADSLAGHLGPLAGILAGMEWAAEQGAEHIVSVAVDTPFFPCDLVPQLLLASEGAGLTIAATADGEHGTFGLWPVNLRKALADYLAGGGRKVRDFTRDHGAALAQFPNSTPPAFFNINTRDDLTQAELWV